MLQELCFGWDYVIMEWPSRNVDICLAVTPPVWRGRETFKQTLWHSLAFLVISRFKAQKLILLILTTGTWRHTRDQAMLCLVCSPYALHARRPALEFSCSPWLSQFTVCILESAQSKGGSFIRTVAPCSVSALGTLQYLRMLCVLLLLPPTPFSLRQTFIAIYWQLEN